MRGNQIKLPKLGSIRIVLHRAIPDEFEVKTVRIVKKHLGWYATLCIQADVDFVEELDLRIMAKGMLGKHTLDAGLGQFVNQVLPWVCFKRGVYYGKVHPYGTSQECPDCGSGSKSP